MKLGSLITSNNPKSKIKVFVEVMHGDADGYSTKELAEYNCTKEQLENNTIPLPEDEWVIDITTLLDNLRQMKEWNNTKWNSRRKLYETVPKWDLMWDEWPMDVHWEGELAMINNTGQGYWIRWFDENGNEYEVEL